MEYIPTYAYRDKSTGGNGRSKKEKKENGESAERERVARGRKTDKMVSEGECDVCVFGGSRRY